MAHSIIAGLSLDSRSQQGDRAVARVKMIKPEEADAPPARSTTGRAAMGPDQ